MNQPPLPRPGARVSVRSNARLAGSPARPVAATTCEFKITRRVEFSDTDMEGIMHFSNFFRFMETAEHAFLRSLGFSAVLARNGLEVGLPRVHAECDYFAPLRFEDEVLIHLFVQRKGLRSLTYGFRFYRLGSPDPREVARGRVTAVCAARQPDGSFKSAPLPGDLAGRIREAPRAARAPAVSDRNGSRSMSGRLLPGAAGARGARGRSPAAHRAARRSRNNSSPVSHE